MDTPDKNRIAAVSLRAFEDSPVFQYISDLSPIEPVKSVNTDHILNSLALVSPSSIFNSPQINCLRESRFSIKRHLSPDVPYSGFLHGGTANTATDVSEAVKVSYPCHEQVKWDAPRRLDEEAKTKSPAEQFDLAIELPKALKNACDSRDIQMVSCDEILTDVGNGTERTESIIKSDEDKMKQKHDPVKVEIDLHENRQGEKFELDDMSDMTALISDVSDLLDSKGRDQKIADPGTGSFMSTLLQFSRNSISNTEKVEYGVSTSCGTQSLGVAQDFHINESLNNPAANDPNAKTQGKEESCLWPSRKRSIRRRCLVFDAGSFRQKPVCDSTSSLSTSLTPNREVPSPEKRLVPSKTYSNNASSTLHAVGLHLNGLVSTSSVGKRFISKAGDALSHSSMVSHESSHVESLTPIPIKKDLVSCVNEVTEDAPGISTEGEHFDNDMPMGKRNRSEHVGENGSCKRCNCRRSKCLKLYCDCFAAGLYCIEPCSCQDCFNQPIHGEIVMNTRKQIEARNPLAFAPKVVTSTESASDFGEENNKTPASARHKRGCNCKRSSCLKKYCECFQMGVGCSPSCRCQACKNTFGRKEEGDETLVNEEDPEDCKRHDALELNLHDDVAMKNEQQDADASFVHASLILSEELGVSNFSHDQPKFKSHLQTIPEDRTSEIPDSTQMLILRSSPLCPSLRSL